MSRPCPIDIDEFAKIEMALAEMGYGGIIRRCVMENGEIGIEYPTHTIPSAVTYMAIRVINPNEPMACWACSEKSYGIGYACYEGDCSSPGGPALPPRELLVARRGNDQTHR